MKNKLSYFILPGILLILFFSFIGCSNMVKSQIDEAANLEPLGRRERRRSLRKLAKVEKITYLGKSGSINMQDGAKPSLLYILIDAKKKNDKKAYNKIKNLFWKLDSLCDAIHDLEKCDDDYNKVQAESFEQTGFAFLERIIILRDKMLQIKELISAGHHSGWRLHDQSWRRGRHRNKRKSHYQHRLEKKVNYIIHKLNKIIKRFDRKINHPPTAYDQEVTTSCNSSIIITLRATDPDCDPLTFHIVSGPDNGSLSPIIQAQALNTLGGRHHHKQKEPCETLVTVTYTPTQPDITVDYFTFEAHDGRVSSDVATVSINIIPCPEISDFGDLPDSYSTIIATNGAQHTIVPGIHLGVTIDAEADGKPSPGADGDDLADLDDEDGVTHSAFILGQTATITVNASVDGVLNVWVDLDNSGTFDAIERILSDLAISAGDNPLPIPVPNNPALHGHKYIRFRFTSKISFGGESPTGSAQDGEVEDYQIEILVPPNLPPVSNPNGPYAQCHREQIVLDGSFSSDPEGSISTYGWIVGGIVFFPSSSPTLNFDTALLTPGTYVVSLKVTDSAGNTNTATTTLDILPLDYGDAVDPTYPTLFVSDGARHCIIPGIHLGVTIDADLDGQPTTGFDGDDLDGNDDEDGLITSPLFVGLPITVTINASAPGFLNIWFDLNMNGTWEHPSEWIAQDITINTTVSTFLATFTTPISFNMRIRYTSYNPGGTLLPTGFASDGEVEDYQLVIQPQELEELDFGDAPDPTYPTRLVNNGARHVISQNVFLGSLIDPETDGQPTIPADGDDTDGTDDEDGVFSFTSLIAGQGATVNILTGGGTPGVLNAWIDFNANGNWNDLGEKIFADAVLIPGMNNLPFNIPGNASTGNTYIRFRLTSAPGMGGSTPTGSASDGEVEDYRINIDEPPVPAQSFDFGDAPDSYLTLLSSNGARHVLKTGGPILGSFIDAEPDGQPTTLADGDDLNGAIPDDEDVFFFIPPLEPGTMPFALIASTSTGGYLNAWIDFNGDGDWLDTGEQFAVDILLVSGDNSLPRFWVPLDAAPGLTYARFRISTATGLTPSGPAPDGEVEDYLVQIDEPVGPF